MIYFCKIESKEGGETVLYAAILLCVAASWWAAELFVRLSPREAALSGLTAGTCCAVAAWLLSLVHVPGLWAIALFLPLGAVLPIQQTRSREERLMATFLALGGTGLLGAACWGLRVLPPVWAACAGGLLAAVFLAAAHGMRGRYPPEDWREFFDGGGQEQMTVRRWHVHMVLGLMALGEIAIFWGDPPPESFFQWVARLLAAAALYWGAVYLVCLMVAYRREKLTALIDQDYRNEMQAFMSVIRSQRHDYNFHVQALSGLMEQGNLEECRAYVDALARDSADMNTILPIRDPAIAALVFSFRTMAREYGIELYLDIQNDLSDVVTSVYETNKVIGNLLQNAIDEVSTHADKSFGIHLYILKRGEDCVIHVANKVHLPKDTKTYLQEIYKPGLSTKTGHEGIGLSSIQNLLNRYRGVVYSRLEGDIIHFVAKIPMELQGGPQ